MCHNSPFVGNPPRHGLCLFAPPGLPTNSNILRRRRPMVLTMIMVIFKMLMICRILMTRVTQSGSHLSRKFPFLLFVSFSPPAEDGRQEKLLVFAPPCPLLLLFSHCPNMCLSYFQYSDKWRVRKLANSSLAS